MKNNRKLVFWSVIAVAIVGLAYLGMRPAPVSVDVGLIKKGPLRVTVDEDGETRIRDPFIVSTPLPGRLLRVELEPGDSVTKQSLLAVIDPEEPVLLDARTEAEAKARIATAKANVERLASEKELLQVEVEKWMRYTERDEGRLSGGQISEPMLKDTRHSLRVARLNLSVGDSALEMARYELDQANAALLHSQSLGSNGAARHFNIKSPIEGVILRKFQESSTIVAAGARIVEVGNSKDLEIRIDVLSQDAVKIKPGQPVIIEHWGGESNLSAQIRRVEPSAFTKVSALGVDEQRVYVYADFDDNQSTESNLGDGFRIEARIIVWQKDEVVLVPAGALFRNEESYAVYVVEDDRAKLRNIEVGKNNGIEAEVLSGIELGEQVVLHPGDRIEEGTVLDVREE